MDDAIERAIECIWERYSEPLSLTQIAESALLSRFYFARLFREATGVTPGRFLAAIRIHQAKRLLLSTPMSITDISSAVGYNSLGSFTNYFTASVGVSPGQFRRLSRTGGFGLPSPPPDPRTGFGAVAGPISLPAGQPGTRVYIGAFATLIMQHPAAAAIVADVPIDRPACYYLPDVPEGTWFVHAVGVADGAGADLGAASGPGAPGAPGASCADRTALVGRHDSVTVTAGNITSAAVRLRYGGPADPPVLLALPDLLPRRSLTVATGRPAS
jgi:AraC family transcriptional regulator